MHRYPGSQPEQGHMNGERHAQGLDGPLLRLLEEEPGGHRGVVAEVAHAAKSLKAILRPMHEVCKVQN
jgi:hypothetical protein